MKQIIVAIVSMFIFSSQSVFAQSEMGQTIFNQLKQKFETSCKNTDYLSCVDISGDTCNQITQDQLTQINEIITANAQAIADGQISELLSQIKNTRTSVLDENKIEVEKANACGKEFLSS